MLTTIEEEVDELWTSRVTSTPMTRPARGLDKTELSLKMSPAVLPGHVEHRSMEGGISGGGTIDSRQIMMNQCAFVCVSSPCYGPFSLMTF